MGEVYRARDTRLGRDVAIKTLPTDFTHDPDRVARFQREAQLLAALNHPNIAGIYGLEETDGSQFIALELVDGETLAQRLKRGPIPRIEALAIGRQIAEALQAAHEKGIIHRDLKPANIALTAEGQVKVLDFGLAKAIAPPEAGPHDSPGLTHSPTLTIAGTQAGMILGTAAYMSPEQARGKGADKRSDIWGFGSVLYEMFTGRRAFEGEDVSETLAFVLAREPDWAALPADLPSSVRTLLKGCLERDRRRRIADIAVALFVLDQQASLIERVEIERPVAQVTALPQPVWRRATALAATMLLVASLAGTAGWFLRRPEPRVVSRTAITAAGPSALVINGTDADLAMTPDGSRVIYRGNNQLLVRAIDTLDPIALTGLGVPRGPFVSPDGQWIGFFDQGTLKKVAITGGPPVTIARVNSNVPRGATWGPDGTIVYARGTILTGLQRVAAAGGDPTTVSKPRLEDGEGSHVWPEFLPGGRTVLFTILSSSGGLDDVQIAALDLAAGTYKVLVRGGHHAHYLRTGHLVYGAGGTLRAVAFDLDRLEVVGTPVPVLEQVLTAATGGVDAAFAQNGTLVYVQGQAGDIERSLVWVDRMGREEPIAAPPRAYVYPRISPDGTRVALDVRDQENDVWTWDLRRQTLTRLTFDRSQDENPIWTPDGRRIIFDSARAGVRNVYWQAADGTGTAERLSSGPNPQYPHSISPDGTRLVLDENTSAGGNNIALLALENSPGTVERKTEMLLQTSFSETNGKISPDGRWLSYYSNESGQNQVYVRPFPKIDGGRWQISTGGGTRPVWARNGRELFYLDSDNALTSVLVEATATTFNAGNPIKLFDRSYANPAPGPGYDVSPDGQRFLMIKESDGDSRQAPQNLIVVQNWFEELRRLVPAN